MTYCLGLLLDAGLVMVADTRTNAGVDNVSSYRKLHPLGHGGERTLFAATCGNLSASQAALERLGGTAGAGLADAASMFDAARQAGEALREANRWVADALEPTQKGSSSMLLGGRIGAGPPRLFLIYEEGNFIECKRDVPYLQIGETKYGRPILDRIVRRDTRLPAAVKIALLSFDSAMRSNLSVARPLDLAIIPADPAEPILERRIEADDPYFDALSARWSRLLADATNDVDDPDFMLPTARSETPARVTRIGR